MRQESLLGEYGAAFSDVVDGTGEIERFAFFAGKTLGVIVAALGIRVLVFTNFMGTAAKRVKGGG